MYTNLNRTNQLLYRANILPKKIADYLCIALLFISIPLTFLFVFTELLPAFHSTDGAFYFFAWFAGLFILFNIESNFFALMLVDTSIKSIVLMPPQQMSQLRRWRFCDDCQTLVPARAWHCRICRTCILRRDHHCLFSGYCVGHYNQRYYLMLLIYLVIGTGATAIYGSLYFWLLNRDIYVNIDTFGKMLCPMLILVIDLSWRNLYLFIYELNVVAFMLTSVLFIYHLSLILRGAVVHERRFKQDLYDFGWQKNLQIVLGKRMYLTWISPLISSDLLHDGINWEVSKTR